jgi:hypothetical protein
MGSNLWLVALGVLLINLPFGFWRAGCRKLSAPWFLAVHAPVPLVVLLRLGAGLGFQLGTVPMMAGAYLAGQFLGGRTRLWLKERPAKTSRSDPPPLSDGPGRSPDR